MGILIDPANIKKKSENKTVEANGTGLVETQDVPLDVECKGIIPRNNITSYQGEGSWPPILFLTKKKKNTTRRRDSEGMQNPRQVKMQSKCNVDSKNGSNDSKACFGHQVINGD